MTRILVVDDEQDLVDHVVNLVQRQGWEAGSAYDGVEAVLKVFEGGWDAVIMDIRMPVLGGLGALKIIHRHDPDLPVVLYTGQAGQGDMMSAYRAGAYACLLKPVDGGQLTKAIKEALTRPSQPGAVRVPVELGDAWLADPAK
jgi:DNA-binding NtrC family response regulator